MITTKHLIITPIDPKTVKLLLSNFNNSYRDNYLSLVQNKENEFYQASELGGIGVKFIIQLPANTNTLRVIGISSESDFKMFIEIFKAFKKINPHLNQEGVPGFFRYRTPRPKSPTLENLLNRNEKLSALLDSFSWLESAHLKFRNESLDLECHNPEFQISLFLHSPPQGFYEEGKSFLVEHEIKESHFFQLLNAYQELFEQSPESISNILFSYTKAEGLK